MGLGIPIPMHTSSSNHMPKMHVFAIGTWDRQTDGRFALSRNARYTSGGQGAAS